MSDKTEQSELEDMKSKLWCLEALAKTLLLDLGVVPGELEGRMPEEIAFNDKQYDLWLLARSDRDWLFELRDQRKIVETTL